MAHATIATRIQKSYKQNAKKLKKSRFSPFLAGLAGALLAIPLMLAIVVPVMRQEFAAQAASLNNRLVSMAPAASFTSGSGVNDVACVAPGSSNNGAASVKPYLKPVVQAASVSLPTSGGSSPGTTGNTTTNNVVTRMISNYRTDNQGSISNTGAGSTNAVTATTTNSTTVSNHNSIEATNNNPQTASSGNVTSSSNTTTGSSTSGAATNTADVSFIFKVNN